MTETTTRTEERGERRGEGERPLCHFGSKSDRPCWREATERVWEEDAEPTVCAEHARYHRLGLEEDALHTALYSLGEWIAGPVKSAHLEELTRFAYEMRDEAEREFWRASVATRAARLVAEQGPGEPELSGAQAEGLAVALLRSDALNHARAILEDLPEEAFGHRSRWPIVAALNVLSEPTNEEVERRRRGLGFK